MKEFEQNNINLFGERAKEWFSELSNILNELAAKWDLSDIKPADNMSWNYVVKADSDIYGPVCLKISIDEDLIANEIKALDYFHGHGMVKMIDHDSEYHAILLHQAIPGASLKNIYPQNVELAIKNYANVFFQLTSVRDKNFDEFKHVRDWLKAFDRIDKNKLPEGLVEKAKATSKRLLLRDGEEFVLHGDLHFDNIILDGDDWIAIDPKGIVGPKEFEAACFNFASDDEVERGAYFSVRLEMLARELQLDKQVLADWVFVRIVLSACWKIEDCGDADFFLKRIKSFSI